MSRNQSNVMICAALALATAAGAAAYDERAISQSNQAFVVSGEAGSKVAFRAAGLLSDLVVIRLPDGSVFASATIEELEWGITGNAHKVPLDRDWLGTTAPNKSISTDGNEPKPALGGAGMIMDDATAVSSGKVNDPFSIDDDTLAKDAGVVTSPSKSRIDDTSHQVWFAFASLPWAFHGGSVSIYRGVELLDRDMILLY